MRFLCVFYVFSMRFLGFFNAFPTIFWVFPRPLLCLSLRLRRREVGARNQRLPHEDHSDSLRSNVVGSAVSSAVQPCAYVPTVSYRNHRKNADPETGIPEAITRRKGRENLYVTIIT